MTADPQFQSFDEDACLRSPKGTDRYVHYTLRLQILPLAATAVREREREREIGRHGKLVGYTLHYIHSNKRRDVYQALVATKVHVFE